MSKAMTFEIYTKPKRAMKGQKSATIDERGVVWIGAWISQYHPTDQIRSVLFLIDRETNSLAFLFTKEARKNAAKPHKTQQKSLQFSARGALQEIEALPKSKSVRQLIKRNHPEFGIIWILGKKL